MAALSYMQRRTSGTYEFRKRLPESLAGKPVPASMRERFRDLVNADTGRFKREVVCSLDTKDLREAKRRNHRKALCVTQLLDSAMSAISDGPPSGSTFVNVREIESEVLGELLSADADERTNGDDRRHLQTVEERSQWPDLVPAVPVPAGQRQTSTTLLSPFAKGMTADHFHAYGEHLAELEGEYREAWARSDPSIVRAETRIALKRRGVPINEDCPEFRETGLAVLRAHVLAYELLGERQRGKIIETPTAVRRDCGPKLSEALASWKAGGSSERGKRPAAKTIVEAERAVRSFQELHSDMPLGAITREHARVFRDALAKAPKAMPNALRNLPLPVLLRRDLSPFQLKSATTVNKLMSLVGGIISQAERDGVLDKQSPPYVNPFTRNMQLRSLDDRDAREQFDHSDLTAIFTSPVYSNNLRPEAGGGAASFWFPLIALLSGMRLDEISQLRLCDLRQDDESGRWFFDIGRTGGRRTKTNSSIRRVPLHLELMRIGLLNYRQSLLDDRGPLESPMWPGVPHSGRWSKWFGRYLRATIGIVDRKKVFHSFRHTFKRMTRDAGLSEELHDALTGHSGHGGVGRTYGRGYSLKPLIAAIDTVAAPIDFKDVTWMGSRPSIRTRAS